MIRTGGRMLWCLPLGLWLLLANDHVHGQNQNAPTQPPPAGTIHGIVKSGNMPIPGAEVSISLDSSLQKASTWTAVDGSYWLPVPSAGSYSVDVQMVSFAKSTQPVVIDPSHPNIEANFELKLLSRTHEPASQPRTPPSNQVARQRGFQALQAMQNMAAQDSGGATNEVVPAGMPVPGIDPHSATESISVSGNASNPSNSMSGDELQQRIADARAQGGGFGGGGGGGFGGGGGGFGGGGPGRVMTITGRRGFDINHPHGSIYYGIGDSAFNAAPYALAGEPATQPGYLQNSFGGSVGGPLNIPHIYQGGAKTFYFVNYNGKLGENPFDQFSTVPTLEERQGNFNGIFYPGTQQQVQIFNPATNTPFPGNIVPGYASQTCPWSGSSGSIADGLLQYIPCPNLPGQFQNFHFVTSATNNSNDLNVRVNHTLGAAPVRGPRGDGRGAPRNNLTLGLHYHGSRVNVTNPFPSVGGSTDVRNFDIPFGYIRSKGKLTNSVRFDFNRSRAHTQNLYAFVNDITGGLGITGVSTNPFDWGLPTLSFADFTGLQDTNPQLLRNQAYTLSDYVVYTHGKHSWRWGGDFRRIDVNTETSSNARGSFTFTGYNTSELAPSQPGQPATQVPGTGFDFADFLLGFPQTTGVQFGANNYHFHGNSWDLYAQDEWKVGSNLTLNLGVRYEYVSPFTEENNLIANLDLSPGVLNPALGTPTVAVITPGQIAPYSGSLSPSLIRPDYKGFAPRVGFAWKPFSKTVARGGYGINYNTGAYQTIALQMAFQPPFSTAETNIQPVAVTPNNGTIIPTAGALTLQSGFPTPLPGDITNSYGVNPNYRWGYVQIRNLDIQQQLRPTLIMNIDYTGTKGTNLDLLEAPNRTISPIGIQIRIPTVQAFTFQNSVGDSEANAGSIRLRKRLSAGFSFGGIYTFSKSIDDASTIGAGATSVGNSAGLGAGGTGASGRGASASAGSGANSVAQNPFDLSAERGLSSFNQTQRFTGDYLWELPFGHDRRWLNNNTPMRAVFGDWQWSGDWTLATGLPFTPRFVSTADEINGGTNGTLRPNVVPGQSVRISNPSIPRWFNTAAFVSPPVGQYGDARRNSIIGPSSKLFDMALTKVIPLNEGRTLEFRAQATNVFNIPNYTSIDTSVTSPTFGRVTMVGGMRQITMTARFRF